MCKIIDQIDKVSSTHSVYSVVTQPPSITNIPSDSSHTSVGSYIFHPDTRVELQLSNKIGFSKFPVFLVESPFQHPLTVKLYPLDNQQVSTAYLNEKRFFAISHPNIVNMLGAVDSQSFKIENGSDSIIEASCIAMEYAPYGDFCDILMTYAVYNDDVLVRTFFHHLIEALKYLHERKISHLDIKLDNLLLGEDFNLKLTDFDLSHIEGDSDIMGKGTQNYRAPEIQNRACSDPISADIYSAGIVLYMLKTGAFPFMEVKEEGHPDYRKQFMEKDEAFWDRYQNTIGNLRKDEDFMKLFSQMVQSDPSVRKTIREIEENNWYKGEIYHTKDIPDALSKVYVNDIG